MDKKIISIYMGNPDNSNHAELELPATPWEMVDAMDRLRLPEGQEPYWQVEDMGRYEFLAPHLDGYDLYQFNALAEKLRTFSDVDAVAFEGLVQMELDKLWQNNGGELTLRRVLDLAYGVDCCHVVPEVRDDAALGKFYVENDFLPELEKVPDKVLEMLDYTREWINQRLQAIQVRKELTDEWDARGVQKGVEYAILTDEISRAWSGMSTRQYKNLKGLKKENLRDNMTTLELVLNMLAEATTTEISKQKSPETFSENLAIVREGGEAAGIARKAVEERTGVPVITSKNAAQLNQIVTELLEGADTSPEKQDKKR